MDMIEKFLKKRLLTNKNTRRNYTHSIKLFFNTIEKKPEDYFNKGNDYEEDIGNFYLALEKEPPMVRKSRINAVKLFLCAYDKSIKDMDIWDTIRAKIRGAEPVSQETPLEKNDIQSILQYGDVCERAMFLIMASSGMRIESLIGLVPSDIHDDEKPCRIVLRPEIVKGKKTTITTFITPEAVDAYHAWMKIRQQWLETAIKRTTFRQCAKCGKQLGKQENQTSTCEVCGPTTVVRLRKSADDPRVFPMTDVNAREMWRKLLLAAGYAERDPKTNRSMAHPHTLRKFFRSWFGNVDLAEHLMGHKGYLSTYRNYDYKQLGREYLKYMDNVTIFSTTPQNVKELQQRDREKDEKIRKLEEDQRIMKLTLESLETRLEVEKLKNRKK